MATAAGPRRLGTYSILRPRKLRTKSGCLACRSRRKKCDEQRPVCHSCSRLQLNCSWPVSESDGSSGDTPFHNNQPDPIQTLRNAPSDPMEDVNELPDVSGDIFVAELQHLGHDLLDLGIFPYTAGATSTIRDQILSSEGSDAAMLFDHFCHKTAPWLVNGNDQNNPILKHIVPLAGQDDLVLRTILAMSAAHLEHAKPAAVSTAMAYYSSAIISLKDRLSAWLDDASKDYRPLLSTTILLCHCEFMHGNSYGTALQHLRACREFVEVALEHLHTPGHRDFVVFLIEHYGYFMLIANVRGSLYEENIRLGLDFSASILPLVKALPSFGSIFAYEPEVFFLIPQIAQLAWQRNQNPLGVADEERVDKYRSLLDAFGESRTLHSNSRATSPASTANEFLVKTIKINTLQIYLHSAFYGCDRDQERTTELLQPLIDESLELLPLVEESNFCDGLNWSVIMIGSYIMDRDKQEMLVRRLQSNKSRMPFVNRGVELLRWLWSDADTTNFGLIGLETVALKHGVDLCIC